MPDSLTINESKSTDKIILVSLNGDIDTDHVTIELCTCLFHTMSLAVTTESSDEHWIKDTRLDDTLDIIEVAEGDKEWVIHGNK